MPDRILGVDSTRALIAVKSCVAIVVGYGLALHFEWDASSVATTIIVLQTAARYPEIRSPHQVVVVFTRQDSPSGSR